MLNAVNRQGCLSPCSMGHTISPGQQTHSWWWMVMVGSRCSIVQTTTRLSRGYSGDCLCLVAYPTPSGPGLRLKYMLHHACHLDLHTITLPFSLEISTCQQPHQRCTVKKCNRNVHHCHESQATFHGSAVGTILPNFPHLLYLWGAVQHEFSAIRHQQDCNASSLGAAEALGGFQRTSTWEATFPNLSPVHGFLCRRCFSKPTIFFCFHLFFDYVFARIDGRSVELLHTFVQYTQPSILCDA
jgi:hypothetical protein